MPELYIITGSNGAGKSSLGANYLPDHINETYRIFDGDKLFIEKRNELWQTLKAPKEVRKLAFEFTVDTFEKQVADALARGSNYVYEGHFTNDATWDTPRKFKVAGYTVNLIFLGLSTPDASQLRVIERSKDGGHWVDRRTIEDNFYGNLQKLQQHLDAVNNIQIIDTTDKHIVVAQIANGTIISSVPLQELPDWFISYLPQITRKIKEIEEDQTSR